MGWRVWKGQSCKWINAAPQLILTPDWQTWFHSPILPYHRRKFRSQTSDNMDRWKAEQGRGREKRKIRREKSRRERVRRKKMEMREKVGKSRFTVFFQWFVAPGGRKVGSLKRRVRSHLARGEMKSCAPLWREAHLEVNFCQNVQNVQSTPLSDHFWRFRCRFASRHYTTEHYTTLHSSTLHYTTLHSSTLHYTKLHYTTLHYTEWHCNTDRQVDS